MTTKRERGQQYSSKWRSLVNFMQHNTGLSVGSVAKAGSRRKGTPSEYSDLDIIFFIRGDPSRETIYAKLIKLIEKNFENATARFGTSRNVIKMKLDNLEFDIVLLPEHKFKNQVQNYKIEPI
ncbi:MAG: nucleotidyltransferase domain-containing protein [Candidatus Heimdallarchaeaceae archaeon]